MEETLLQRYIRQQPALWQSLLARRETLAAPFASLLGGRMPDRVILLGSGSSHYAALMARPVLERAFATEVSCLVPSQCSSLEYCRAENPLYIAVSQSGASTNTYELMCALRAKGRTVAALTQYPDSPVGRAAALTVPLPIGEEQIGAKTKGVTATVLTLMLLALSVCRAPSYRGILYAAMERLAQSAGENLSRARQWSRLNQALLLRFRQFTVLGGQDGLGAAQEGALKLLETNYLPVSSYPLDEYVHGIQNALDRETCLLCLLPPEGDDRARMLELISFARSVGGCCLLAASGEVEDPGAVCLEDPGAVELRCLAYLPALQTLAADLSAARGIDTARRRYPDFFSRMGSKLE